MKTILYQFRIQGQDVAIRNQEELRLLLKQLNQEFKRADFGSKKFNELGRDIGKVKQIQKDLRADVRDLGREYTIAADKGERSYNAMQAELSNLKREYKQLTQAEREAAKGRDLQVKIRGLSTELKELDKGLGDNFRNVGNY